MKEWYTVKELAEKTNIPDTTIRRYIDKFKEFFVFKGGARSRRYEESALKVLIRIKNLFDGGYESDQVYDMLKNEFPMVVDDNKDTRDVEHSVSTLMTAEDWNELRDAYEEQQEINRMILEKMESQEGFNRVLLEQLQKQETYIRESLDKRDQQLMEAIRSNQEERKMLMEIAAAKEKEVEKKKGIFSRLFGGNG